MKLSEMKQILSERGIQLTKSLGQNFLHDGNQLRRIVDAAELAKEDKVLEIGPGLGPLTELLVERAGEVLAIEKDERLFATLNERIDAPLFHLLHDDALDYLKRETRNWTGWKVVSNLPYSVASPIVVELALASSAPELIVATLQIDVAKRLTAGPGEKDYGLLTLLIQLEYEPTGAFKIPASCFFPEPDVDSACVTLKRRLPALLDAEQRQVFSKVVKRAFSQRRKMMLKLLKEDWPAENLEQRFEQLQMSFQIRAESVTLDQFVSLTGGLVQRPEKRSE
jgi:16S rRNA (adenine1518-N6/adenine1519-N6)-dimethyltransferase